MKLFFTTLLSLTLLAGCSDGGSSDKPLQSGIASLKAYQSNSPYADVLPSCVTAESVSKSCSLNTLPFIGTETNSPDIDDIMARVAVSHTWMGDRFEEVLRQLPPQTLALFQAVTAIVIASDIRPSFYTRETGAIYLDSNFFWLSLPEKRTISLKEDFRSDFGNDLDFIAASRYLKDGQRAYHYGSLTDDSTRSLDDIILIVARILFHELAHANDFIPPGSYTYISGLLKPREAINNLAGQQLSVDLATRYPLESDTLYSLAGVMFRGNTASNAEREITSQEVGFEFEPDGANDAYNYSNRYEDFAMLMEASLMKYFYDVDFEVMFIDRPNVVRTCSDWRIGWGQRNRLGDLAVKDRANFAVSSAMPNISFATFFAGLSSPEDSLSTWCLPSTGISSFSHSLKDDKLMKEDLLKPYL